MNPKYILHENDGHPLLAAVRFAARERQPVWYACGAPVEQRRHLEAFVEDGGLRSIDVLPDFIRTGYRVWGVYDDTPFELWILSEGLTPCVVRRGTDYLQHTTVRAGGPVEAVCGPFQEASTFPVWKAEQFVRELGPGYHVEVVQDWNHPPVS